ncbi:hypothetical protein CYQ82_12935, partial [Enterococcus faecium]
MAGVFFLRGVYGRIFKNGFFYWGGFFFFFFFFLKKITGKKELCPGRRNGAVAPPTPTPKIIFVRGLYHGK